MDSSLLDLTAPMPELPESPASGESTMSRRTVGVGIGCIAALVGYAVYRSYMPVPSQALIGSTTSRAAAGGGDAQSHASRLACVNFSEDDQVSMRDAFSTLGQDSGDGRVELEFHTVTFYDDAPELTPSILRESTRGATLFAYRELNRSLKTPQTACLFMQTALMVDGETPESADTNAHLLQRADGRTLLQRRSLGFSADGTGAEVVEWESYGVIESRRALRRWATPELLARQSIDRVLQFSCVPSETSFTVHARIPRGGSTPSHEAPRSCKEDRIALCVPTVADREGPAFPDAAFVRWWQSSLPVSLVTSTALRFARADDGGLAALLVGSQPSESLVVKLCQFAKTLGAWLGRATRPTATDAPHQTEQHTEADDVTCDRMARAQAETPHAPYAAGPFAIAFESERASLDLVPELVSFWETQITGIVAKTSHRRLGDVATCVYCLSTTSTDRNGGVAGGAGGVAFQLPVDVTLVEALTVALDCASLFAWSGFAPSRVRVAALVETAGSSSSSSSVVPGIKMDRVPFQSGSCDLLSQPCGATATDKEWHVLTDFS